MRARIARIIGYLRKGKVGPPLGASPVKQLEILVTGGRASGKETNYSRVSQLANKVS